MAHWCYTNDGAPTTFPSCDRCVVDVILLLPGASAISALRATPVRPHNCVTNAIVLPLRGLWRVNTPQSMCNNKVGSMCPCTFTDVGTPSCHSVSTHL